MATTTSFFGKVWKFMKTTWGIVLTIIIVILLGYLLLHKKPAQKSFVTVKRGSITEEVSVTGNTTPTQSVSLGFQNSGVIASVNAHIGDTVYAGQLLASLNTSDLSAQLKQAQATVDTQQAKLSGLQTGAQPDDIAASEAAFNASEQTLANYYGSVADTSNDAFAKANDAVRAQVNNLFSNAENNYVQLTFNTSNSQAANDVKQERIDMTTTLNSWQTALIGLSMSTSADTLDSFIQQQVLALNQSRKMLLDLSTALDGAVNLDAATVATDKAEVTSAISEINTASKSLNTLAQNIATQKITVSQTQAQLNLKQAGATTQDIEAQKAQVEQAQAGVLSIEAKIANSRIVSPINGIVTQFDAKVGQVASPGTPLVSVISGSQFEVDALIPETDVGKIAVGNPVIMSFDAFPGQTFTGKLFYVDPAQTITSGVVDYKIKVSFDATNPKMKSGLTADLTIQTQTHDNALILPQYAILQNDQGTFVQTLVNGVATNTPITLGISDENDNVEILSGVTEGEQVLNIGLKQ